MVNIKNVKQVEHAKFDTIKTNELVEDLKKQGIIAEVEDLAGYIRKQGLIVKEHIGRKRNTVQVSEKMYGVDMSQKDDNVKEFFKEYLKRAKMTFIPDTQEKLLSNLESSVRMMRRRASIGYDESFMTLETFEAFSREVDKRKAEYFAIRDHIVENWDKLINQFKSGLRESLNALNAIDKDSVFETIMSKLPTKEDYSESFYITLSVKAFPVQENLDMFDDSIKEQIRQGLNQETIETLYEIIGNILDDAFDNVNRFLLATLKQNDTGMSVKTLDAINNSATRIGQKNIFNNPKINKIGKALNALRSSALADKFADLSEEAENLMAIIYGYAKELRIDGAISMTGCALSEDELLSIYDMLSDSVDATLDELANVQTEEFGQVEMDYLSA